MSLMRTAATAATLGALLLLSACGAPQATTTTDTAPTEGAARETPNTPRGPTADERAAQERNAARAAFMEAAELYAAGTRGERDYRRIEQLLERALEVDSSLVDAWFNLGIVKDEQGDETGAIAAYERAGTVDPTYARGLANIGHIHLRRGDLGAAQQVLEACVARSQIEPGCNINLAILYQRGQVAAPGGDVNGASIERLRFALGGEALNADAYANIARIYHEQGRLELARLVCENAILQGIEAATLHNRLGLIALDQEDVLTAYQEFQRAVRVDPDFLDAHMNIGAMAMSFRDYGAAAAAFERVRREREDDLALRLSFGAALRGLERYDEAQAEYRAVLSADPTNTGALYNLAVLHQESLQDYSAACGFFKQFQASPTASASPRFADVTQRLDNLRILVETMVDFGEMDASILAACAP